MRNILIGLAVSVFLVSSAQAQVRGGDPYDGVPRPQDMRPLGMQMGMYLSTNLPAYFPSDDCGDDGCIIVINKARRYDVTQFYINDGKRDAVDAPVWGLNQFKGFSLHPSKALWTPRPRKMKCELTVKVVMRNRDTREELEGVQPFDLCAMPKAGFAILEINMPEGRVILPRAPEKN